MENNSSFETKFLSVDLEFWKENLKYENKRLEELIVFSNGAEHSGTMDARRNIKRFELKIAELEEKFLRQNPTGPWKKY